METQSGSEFLFDFWEVLRGRYTQQVYFQFEIRLAGFLPQSLIIHHSLIRYVKSFHCRKPLVKATSLRVLLLFLLGREHGVVNFGVIKLNQLDDVDLGADGR